MMLALARQTWRTYILSSFTPKLAGNAPHEACSTSSQHQQVVNVSKTLTWWGAAYL